MSVSDVVARILREAEGLEFHTFVVGFARPAGYDRGGHEAKFRETKIRIGSELVRRWPDRKVDFRRPHVRFDVGVDLSVHVRIAPLFLAARYRKLSREVPASRWIHHACHGAGCASCHYTGNLCGPSVEEIVSSVALRSTRGKQAFFHAMGREDTDARMLGGGRPFVLEIQEPRLRSLDLNEFVDGVEREGHGLAEILAPAVVERSAVRLIKGTTAEKTYRAWLSIKGHLPPDTKHRVACLAGRTVGQYSPKRVMHRRGRDRQRRRTILASTWLGELNDLFLWEVRAEAGTYIKELVSGDEDRTSPSLSEILGVEARCTALDVLEVHWRGPWEETPT